MSEKSLRFEFEAYQQFACRPTLASYWNVEHQQRLYHMNKKQRGKTIWEIYFTVLWFLEIFLQTQILSQSKTRPELKFSKNFLNSLLFCFCLYVDVDSIHSVEIEINFLFFFFIFGNFKELLRENHFVVLSIFLVVFLFFLSFLCRMNIWEMHTQNTQNKRVKKFYSILFHKLKTPETATSTDNFEVS